MNTPVYMITGLGFGLCLMHAAVHFDKHRQPHWIALGAALVLAVVGVLNIYL